LVSLAESRSTTIINRQQRLIALSASVLTADHHLDVASDVGKPFLCNFASRELIREGKFLKQGPIIGMDKTRIQNYSYESVTCTNRTVGVSQ
jgi:hypothetical protein